MRQGCLTFLRTRKESKKAQKSADALQKEGHSCVTITKTFPPMVMYCGKTECGR